MVATKRKILKSAPAGWVKVSGATTTPIGYDLWSNNKSRFGGERKTALVLKGDWIRKDYQKGRVVFTSRKKMRGIGVAKFPVTLDKPWMVYVMKRNAQITKREFFKSREQALKTALSKLR